jgi:hypothetical protein
MPQWPHQSECDSFYGNPRGRNGRASPSWEAANLTKIEPPFKLYYDKRPVRTVLIHKKCAESLLRVFESLWKTSGKDQKTIDEWGVSDYGGCYNFRLMRGSGRLSMHAYACAIDLDPSRNGLNDSTPRFAEYPWVIDAFEAEGWVWGGNWSRPDGMHFQAARV